MAYIKKSKSIPDPQKTIDSAFDSFIGQKFLEKNTNEKGIVSIERFCSDWLEVKPEWKMFRLILKLYYYNTLGNENVEITDEDIALVGSIDNYGLGQPWVIDKIVKMKNGEINRPFQTIVLALGRRSGKTWMASAIIAYEAYKLLAMIICISCKDIKPVKSGELCPDCGSICKNHPQLYYDVSKLEPLRILLAATRLEQALDPGFNFCKDKILTCPYFEGKYYLEQECIYFKTEYDNEMNEKLRKAGQQELKGSIIIKPISSNATGAHGTGCVAVLFDEFALFNNEGKDTDTAILAALQPQTITYRKKRNDGRIIMISMPDGESGQFYNYFCDGKSSNNIISFQLPTWEYNPGLTQEDCLEQSTEITEKEGLSFDKLFGAQFTNDGENVYLPESYVNKAYSFPDNFELKSRAHHPHHKYYMHIDCAFTSCNYAYAVCHIEKKVNAQGTNETFYVEDDAYFWTPSINNPGMFVDLKGDLVNINQVLDKIILKAKAFRVNCLSYDNMQSIESQNHFRSHGLPLRQLSFSGYQKAKIFGVLKTAIMQERFIGNMEDIRGKRELICLRQHFSKRGPQITPSKNGIVKTEDVADCIAGACYMSIQKDGIRFARSVAVSTAYSGMPQSGRLGGPGQSIFSRANLLKGYNGGFSNQ